jgi:hypothetical protein
LKTLIIAITAAMFLSGCSGLMVSNLGDAPAVDSNMISIADKRVPEDKRAKRDSTMSPISRLGDDNVQPAAIIFLQNSLQKNQKQAAFLKVEMTEFHVIDYFPARMNWSLLGNVSLHHVIMKELVKSATDWEFINKVGVPEGTDTIIVLFTGTVNGKEVKVATYAPYSMSAWAGSVRNNPAFTNAVKKAIDSAAKEILAKIES